MACQDMLSVVHAVQACHWQCAAMLAVSFVVRRCYLAS